MASECQRRQTRWTKFRTPIEGRIIRESFETNDEVRAELLRSRLDLEVALLEPRFRAAEIPTRLREVLALEDFAHTPVMAPASSSPSTHFVQISPQPVAPKRATGDEAGASYFRFIASENARLHSSFPRVCLKFDLYHLTNWHRPNPIAALPGYVSKDRRIVFLTQAQVDE